MRIHFAQLLPALLAFTGPSMAFYTRNCKGSAISLNPGDCDGSLADIDINAMYNDQTQFSRGNCYLKYATNGYGPQPVSGQVIKDTANEILSECPSRHGSAPTYNCEKCHVTVNYRAD